MGNNRVEGDFSKIYDNYVTWHPECQTLNKEAVWLKIKEDGIITEEQYNMIKKGMLFDFKSSKPSPVETNWKSLSKRIRIRC